MVARIVTVSDKQVEVNEFPRVVADIIKGWEPIKEDDLRLNQEVYQSRYLASVPVERISGLVSCESMSNLFSNKPIYLALKTFSPGIQGISYFRKLRACSCQTVPSIPVPVSGNDHEDVCHVANRRIPREPQGMSSQNVCEAQYGVTGPLLLIA
jgi:hypothetical protein